MFKRIASYIKRNPTQEVSRNSTPGGTRTTRAPYTLSKAYRDFEIVNRGVNMIVDGAAQLDYDVKGKFDSSVVYGTGMRQDSLQAKLNVRPNQFMDVSTFRRLVFMDMVMEGFATIYYDELSKSMYHVPSAQVQIVLDDHKYINKFVIGGKDYGPHEIILIKDNAYWTSSVSSTGFSRLASATDTIKKLEKLELFKEKFYDNGAVLGLVIETDTLLSKKRKSEYEQDVSIEHNPRTGKSNVLVLDGGFKAKTIANTNFRDLGVGEDIKNYEKSIAVSLGIPPILFDSGNNANIKPNVELLYSMTIMPMVVKFEKALEFFFNYDIKIITSDVMALTPDKEAQAKWIASLVNNGLMTGDEGRIELRLPPMDTEEMTTIRIPQNVAGSGTGVAGQEGGKPKEE